MIETWDLWFPSLGATGICFGRSRIESAAAGDRLLVHAAPPELDVVVRDEDGKVVASGQGLERTQPGPMSYLVRAGETIHLDEGWPSSRDVGRLVLLPGGEAGTLLGWWHAEDHSEWRWEVRFYNHT